MNAEIVSIGTEILLGDIVDTNAAHIARTLRDIGVNVYFKTTVGDNLTRIADVIRLGVSRSHLIITTGGLGPTVDDVTREGIALATNQELVFHQTLLDQITTRFTNFGVKMSENNKRQAYTPANAIPIENPVGTAPCFIVKHNSTTIICLPGVPSEMKYILKNSVIPYIQENMESNRIIKTLILRTAGIGESMLDEKIADLMTNSNPTVGLSAHMGQTDIRITTLAATHSEADTMLTQMENLVREYAGEFIYGTGDDKLEDAFTQLLANHNWKLAICEAGTDRALRERLEKAQGNYPVLSYAEDFPTIEALRTSLSSEYAEDDLKGIVQAAADRIKHVSSPDFFIIVATQNSGSEILVGSPTLLQNRSYSYGGQISQATFGLTTWGISMAWRFASRLSDSEKYRRE